jgi:hypothetical protein
MRYGAGNQPTAHIYETTSTSTVQGWVPAAWSQHRPGYQGESLLFDVQTGKGPPPCDEDEDCQGSDGRPVAQRYDAGEKRAKLPVAATEWATGKR